MDANFAGSKHYNKLEKQVSLAQFKKIGQFSILGKVTDNSQQSRASLVWKQIDTWIPHI